MRMHYVPRLLLRRFVDEGGLWELDVTTAVCERRNIDNAGKERHLYTVALETGFLKAIDKDAADILIAKVYDRDVIDLSGADRQRLAQWFASLIHRNPKKSAEVDRALLDPQGVLDPDIDYAHEYVEAFKREHPAEWGDAVAQVESDDEFVEAIAVVGAEECLRQSVMKDVNEQIRTGIFKGDTSVRGIFSRAINQSRSEEWAAWMLDLKWEWLRTDHEFIIGDDPVSRWSTRLKHIEYGFSHADCEVTMPLSRHISLCMRHDGVSSGIVKACDYHTTCKYNNRQILAATKKVFGSSRQMQREKERADDIAAGRCGLPKGG